MAFHVVQIAIIVFGMLASIYLFFKTPFLSNARNPLSTGKKVSVIIPCRNEEHTISLLLNDLFSQTFLPHEIIVVDDNSTDNTLRVANSFPVKVVAVKDKNPHYLGKSWAVETGSLHATGDCLLFLDADVRLGKDAMKSLMGLMESGASKIITVQPFHETKKLFEQFSLPFNLIQLAANAVTTAHGKPFGLYGPVILMDANTYATIGRHYFVRQSIIEDVSLGIHLRSQGYDFQAYLGMPEIRFRMYSSFKSLFQGWTKNIAHGASKTSAFHTFLIFFFIASILGTPLGMIASFIQQNAFIFSIYVFCYIFWVLRLKLIAKPIGQFHIFSFVLYPVVFIMFLFLFVVSMFKKMFHLPVKWKGRSIGRES